MKRGFTITAALVVATLALLMGMVMFAGAIDSVRTGMLEGFSLTRVVKSAIQGLGLHCVLIGNKWLLRSVGLYQVFQTFSFVVGGLLASVFYSYGDFRLREDRFGLITAVLLSAVIPVPPTAMGSFGGP